MRLMLPDREILVRTIRIPTAHGSIPALLLSLCTATDNATGVLWLHGGGYAVGMKEMVHMSRAVGLVKRFGVVVLAPGYRLSLQSPYPAAMDDCYAALLYLKEHAAALGVRFFDRQGRSFVPTGITLAGIADIDLSRRHPALDDVPLTVMCDIDNPLYGALGAAYVFAPQKGADAACVQRLDEGLRHFAAVLRQRLGIPVDKLPGGGAAGGFGAGCAALLGGTLRSGIETVLDTVDFDRCAAGYDLIVTGEGRLDSQSLGGKAVSGVAGRCRALGVPAAALVGALALEPDDLAALGLCSARSINPAGVTLQDAKAHAAAYYRDALAKLLEEMS